MAKDEEREFRLRPRKPPARNERAAWASAYKILMHHARMSRSRKSGPAGLGTGGSACRERSARDHSMGDELTAIHRQTP